MLQNGSRLWQVVGMATGVRCSCTCLWLVSEFVTSSAVKKMNKYIAFWGFFLAVNGGVFTVFFSVFLFHTLAEFFSFSHATTLVRLFVF